MPEFFQDLTLLNPMRYGLELIQRIFLEGAGFMGPLAPLRGHHARYHRNRRGRHLLLPPQNLLTETQAAPAAHP